MNIGEPIREIDCEPVQWPLATPEHPNPSPKALPAEIPTEPAPRQD